MEEKKENEINEEYLLPREKEQVTTGNFSMKLPKKLLDDYSALCKEKGTNRSKRLRNFMIFELKKDAQRIEAERLEKEKLMQLNEVIESNDDFEKPKDLNTSASEY